MNKLELNFSELGTTLSKDQMKKIKGGNEPLRNCDTSGWMAHNSNWTAFTFASSEEQAIFDMNYYGYSNYCNSSCRTSCCTAKPGASGC